LLSICRHHAAMAKFIATRSISAAVPLALALLAHLAA
jgi:hypothetical protein